MPEKYRITARPFGHDTSCPYKKGKNGAPDQFEVNEKQMSDDDLKAVREISRRLDEDDSPYRGVVSVLMLREGWDVRNVTTIVPLRAFSGGGGILAEQTLGRGLRRMTPPGGAPERVTVIEHSQFVKLYEQELALEGVVIPTTDVNKKPKPPTVSIFIDKTKPIEQLDIAWPQISDSVQSIPTLNNLTWEDVDARFRDSYQPLPIDKPSKSSIEFEMRSLFTDELVASWKIDRGLLSLGYTAVSVFVKELEKACKLQSAFATLGPVMQKFIEQTLFEKPVSLYDGSIDHRMNHSDVAEHIRATFAPLILERTVLEIKRERRETLVSLSEWKPFQAAQTPQKPVVVAKKTPFNLVPCDRDLEKNFALFCDDAEDVEAFAKNAGPQKLLIDYKTPGGRKADYIPDFFVRGSDGVHYLVETKGVQDVLVPFKARAAVQWCKTASTKTRKWQYVYLPMPIFEENLDESMEILARACAPSLKNLLSRLETEQLDLPLDSTPDEVKQERTNKVLEEAGIAAVPESLRQFVEQAVNQLAYDRRKNYPQFGSAFSPLLYPFEELAGELLHKYLAARVPASGSERAYYFVPDLSDLDYKLEKRFERVGKDLRQNLVYGTNSNRIGTALFCLRHAANGDPEVGGVWQDVREKLASQEMKTLSAKLDAMYDFRNRFVAHGDELLTDGDKADEEMKDWIAGLMELHAVAAGATTN